jgi:hypothetical protein
MVVVMGWGGLNRDGLQVHDHYHHLIHSLLYTKDLLSTCHRVFVGSSVTSRAQVVCEVTLPPGHYTHTCG